MITEFRQNLDIVIVVAAALLAYHLYKKHVLGIPRGIAAE